MTTHQLLYGVCVLLTGLVAGLFYGYQYSVINGLGALKDREYLSAFQNINRVIQNPVFFASFLGCVVLLPLATYAVYKTETGSVTFYVLAATITYVIGVFGITIFFNVPLNNALGAFDIQSATDSQAQAMRLGFERTWNKWHLVRTLAAIASFIMLIIPAALTSFTDKKTNDQFTDQQQKLNTTNMKNVLIIGMDPHAIDFTNPELPKGLTTEIIQQGTQATLTKLISIGYHAEAFLIETGATNLGNLAKQLEEKNYDGVVIGNGIRGIKANFKVFEQVVNVVHSNAPKAKIIFNNLPTDTDEAVKRWL